MSPAPGDRIVVQEVTDAELRAADVTAEHIPVATIAAGRISANPSTLGGRIPAVSIHVPALDISALSKEVPHVR